MWKMVFRKKHVKRTLELIGAVAIVYLMLEILEANTLKPEPIIYPRAPAYRPADVFPPVPPGGGAAAPPAVQAPVQPPAAPAGGALPPPVEPPAAVIAPVAVPVAPVAPIVPVAVDPVIPPKPDDPLIPPVAGVQPPLPPIPDPNAGEAAGGDAAAKGWLLPMLYFDMGPNNLFRLLRQGAVDAYGLGRGVTVPVFHRHPRMGDAAKNPFVLPIYDTNYTVDLVWPAGDTIDVGMLKKVVPVQGMREMQVMCNQQIDALIKCGDIDAKRYEGIVHFQRAINMPVQKEILIKSMEELNTKSCGMTACPEQKPASVDISAYKCVGMVYGKKCLPDQEQWLAQFTEIARNFLRPTVIRRFSQDFLEKIILNKPYLFVHWRYESDWLDMCKPSRPKGARERNKEICKLIMGLTYDESTRSMFVTNLKAKMAEYNLETVYLASPPNNIDLIRLLNSSFPGNFFYMDDVMKFSNKTMGPEFLDNNYKASFVEQEIGFRSTFYLGASLSSWTQTVLTDRLARNNKKHDSVLKIVTNGAPGYPELVFQFPEGSFTFGGMIAGKKV